jgi:hypothetical protein
LLGTNEVIDRARRDDDGGDTWGVVTKNGDIATEVWSRDM